MKKKSYVFYSVIIFAVAMLNISLNCSNNKIFNSISLLAGQAFAHELEYPHHHNAAIYEHDCEAYDPKSGLYGPGIEVDCVNASSGSCTSMNCRPVYGG